MTASAPPEAHTEEVMKRRFLMFVLALGAVAGFGAGFSRLHHCREARRAAFERHVAQICVEAARGVRPPAPPPTTPAPPAAPGR